MSSTNDPARKIQGTLPLLQRAYGERPWQCWGKAVPVLVETILSQNTSAANSTAGYRQLWRAFRSWNRVADAPVEQVERAIRVSGLSRIKAPRIQSILRQIREARGKIDLEFLRDYAPEEAYEYLTGFTGVGPKTANCVLLFSFGMPVFPVDTHIHRIAMRLGVIAAASSADDAHRLLLPMIPAEDRYSMHVLLIEHGRKTCKAQNPKCGECCLRELCPSADALAERGEAELKEPMPALIRRRPAGGRGSRRAEGSGSSLDAPNPA